METTQTSLNESEDRKATLASPSTASLDLILQLVHGYWGYDTLRPLQEEAIRATLEGRDSVVVLPTGGGKSLCYQIPPAIASQTHIVVSPLISLMKDQVDGLIACDYPAAALHSGMTADEKNETMRDLKAGKLRLLFVSPERLVMPGFLHLLSQLDIRAFAIDEAHCISQWGHDFRPEYRQLAVLQDRFPQASVHAYTATATERVREDIAAQLCLTKPAMLVGTFDRPNLIYRIVPRLDVHAQVIEVIRRHAREAAIIYCLSRKDTETMAGALKKVGINARAYHAGLSQSQRNSTQEAFANESLDVVAATVAFGMGIDRSNVRCVIHATMPKSIEHYQQETGRAGRDGLEAECVLFYSAGDIMRWKSLFERSAEDLDDAVHIIAAQTLLLEDMRRYCTVPSCRHCTLSEHFGQAYPEPDCKACDICLGETAAAEEATEIAQKILSSVARIQRLSGISYGIGHNADVLIGANTQAIRQRGHDQATTYGLLKGTPKKVLTQWMYQLFDQNLLSRSSGDLPVLELNEASWEVLRGNRKVKLMKTAIETVKETSISTISWDGVDRDLFEHLRNIRRELSEKSSVPAFVIFSDRTLRDLARRRPTELIMFKAAHGIGDAKVKKFGKRFCLEISDFCREHSLSVDIVIDPNSASETAPAAPSPTTQTNTAKITAFEMFAKGKTIDAVMTALSRAQTTTAGYLCDFIEETKPKSVEKWVSKSIYVEVAGAADHVGFDKLKPIYEHLKEKVAYHQIKIVLAHARNHQE